MSSQVDDRPATNGHVAADPSLRTFRGRSLEEVLPQIRAELGPDAVVVRQREGLMGGIGGFFQQQFVEVQARPGTQRIDLYDEAPATPAAPPATPEQAAPAPSAPTPAPAPAAETPQERPAAPAQLSAAELLRAATGGAAGDGRTPAEILREHSDTFARQLAAAEERAEPTVARAQPASQPAAEEPEIPQRRAYATPRQESPAPAAPQAAAAADEPIPLPQRPAPAPVPAPAPDLPPAAAAPVEAAPTAVNGTAAAVNGTAAKPAKRRAARARTQARARARARAQARARARAARASRAVAKAKPAAPAPKPQPVPAPALVDDPEPTDGGVGPQTAHALELAAAIAASVGAPRALPAASAPSAGSAGLASPAGDAPAALPAPGPAVLPGISTPRRSLFGRRGRRGGPTTPRVVAGGPEAALVVDQLETFGLAPAATEELLLDATAHVLPFTAGSDVRSAIRSALARRIPTLPPPRIGGRAVAFVGAGGGGKTRCTAGLVAAYAQGSTLPVACVTLAPADGGAELSGLLKPHGVRVEVADDAERAAERIAALRSEAVVVLDTPPAAPADPAAIEALSAALAPMELDEIQLVVPATLSAAVAQELVERLSPLGATGITMTHADETDHIGAVVELSCATRLPLSYVNSGLALPGALAPADPVALAERLLP